MSQRPVPAASPDALRTEPVSRVFGLDLGTSICRHYLKGFLASHAGRIQGRVLEVGDNAYTLAYGAGVTQSDVLNAVPAPNATVVGDLCTGAGLPRAAFDCIILTQTIQCIYDFKSALRNAYQSLRPGGALLLSASGISQISRYDMDRWGEYWRFTDLSLRLALEETCPGATVAVQTWGNVAAAKGYLDGLPAEAFPVAVLDAADPDYQMVLTALVERPATDRPSLVPVDGPDGWTDLLVPDDLSGLRAFAEAHRLGRWRVRFQGLLIHCLDLLDFHARAEALFLQGTYDFQVQVVHPVVLDAGAHIGLFTLRAKALHPGARVLALEPDAGARELLRLNCAANNLKDVEISDAGDLSGLRTWLEAQSVDLLRLDLGQASLAALEGCAGFLRRARTLTLKLPAEAQELYGLLTLLQGQGFRTAVRGGAAQGGLLVRAQGAGGAEQGAPDKFPGRAPARAAGHPGGSLACELAVVVRGVGERTTAACLDLLRQELPEENISLLREMPFSRAVACTYERGLASGRPWVLALDADVLLRPGILADLVARAQAQPNTVFALWTLCLDKAFLAYRPVGMHLYRASLLPQAQALTQDSGFEQSLRPESAMVERMLAKGWHAAQTDLLAGLHDYGQAYGHLASKGFLHARKHAPFVELLAPYWASLGQADADYRALAAGARLGLGHQGAVRVDSRLLTELTARALETLDLPDPAPLGQGAALAAQVQAVLAEMDADPQRQALQERIFPRHFWNRLDGGGA